MAKAARASTPRKRAKKKDNATVGQKGLPMTEERTERERQSIEEIRRLLSEVRGELRR